MRNSNLPEPTVRLMRLVRDLMLVDESFIKRGRMNTEWERTCDDMIVIDSVAPARAVSRSTKYDGDSERMKIETGWRCEYTASFLGPRAFGLADSMAHLLKTELALDLQLEHGIFVTASNVVDVKMLTGHDYAGRVDLTLPTEYITALERKTRRIDTAVIQSIQTEENKWLTFLE